jgi:Flp pilus assembly protein TadD
VHAIALLRLGKVDEAEHVLRTAAEDLLARGIAASGELAEHFHGLAIDDGYALLAKYASSKYPFTTAHFSKHLLDEGDVEEAIRLANTALRAVPTHPVLLVQAARASQNGGRHDRARALVRRLKRVAPNLRLVRTLRQQGAR